MVSVHPKGYAICLTFTVGADGATNSFTNFKNAALQIGASLSSAAASATTAASSVEASGSATAAYGGYTIAPAVRFTCLILIFLFEIL